MFKGNMANIATHLALQAMAFSFNYLPKFKEYLCTDDGRFNFSIGLRTEKGDVEQCISFRDGKVNVSGKIPADVDTEMVFLDTSILKDLASLPPNEVLNLILKNKLIVKGNLVYAQLFNFFISLFVKGKQIEMMKSQGQESPAVSCSGIGANPSPARGENKQLKGDTIDPGVLYLKDDPYLSHYSLKDFPRLQRFLDIHFTVKPVICHERPLLLTQWFRNNGFETKKDGKPWVPELRQANAFKHLMENRKPIIRKNDLIAGTTTTNEIGVVLYPDSHGTMIWGELLRPPTGGSFPTISAMIPEKSSITPCFPSGQGGTSRNG